MSDVVFVIGAGASRRAGVPLMSEFLDRSRDLAMAKQWSDVQVVFDAIQQLQGVHSKTKLDIRNLEAVFNAFEMATLLNMCCGLEPVQIAELVPALRKLIVRTIEATMDIPVVNGAIAAPEPYGRFVTLLETLRSERECTASVITFNYDLALDLALSVAGVPVDYGLEDRTVRQSIRLLKLHGSLNWARCPRTSPPCAQVHVSTFEHFARHHRPNLAISPLHLRYSDGLNSITGCDGALLRTEPLIVPPSWSKREHHEPLRRIWMAAAQELSAAHSIVCIGYSLPAADAFVRLLLALGTASSYPLKRFWVFDPDPSGEVERRYREMLGAGIVGPEAHSVYRYEKIDFHSAIKMLSDAGGGLSLVRT